MIHKMTRPDTLPGTTLCLTLEDGSRAYITVNEQDGQPVEVFVRYDDPKLYEWITLATVFITRMLRDGNTLDAIAREMQEIFSPQGGYHASGEQHTSIVAHIGKVLEDYCNKEKVAA